MNPEGKAGVFRLSGRIAAIISVLAGLAGCGAVAQTEPALSLATETGRPDIVLIYADDLGLGDVGHYNPDSKIPTPHIDAIAQSGIWLSDGHSTSAVCTPSRYALMTGRYAWRTELRSGVLMPWGRPVVEPERTTLPEYLKAKGYETSLIGKWHLGFDWPWVDAAGQPAERPDDADILQQGWISTAKNHRFDWSRRLKNGPLDHGFDTYLGDDIPNMPPYAWIENDKIQADRLIDVPRSSLISIGFEGGIHGSGPGEPGWQLDQVMPALVDQAVKTLESRGDESDPLFLMLSLTAPHTPIVPLPEFDGTSEVGTYGDFVVQTDAAVGAVTDALSRSGRLDNTLLIVTSDNGPEFQAYRAWSRYDHDGVAGRRGIKADIWEGGHRVPFVMQWPAGGLSGGREIHGTIAQVDLYATLSGLLESDTGSLHVGDSIDVSPALLGRSPDARETLVYHGSRGTLALRQGDWVYMPEGGFGRSPLPLWSEPQWVRDRRGVDRDGATTAALYNLRKDPGQLDNVIDDHPQRASSMAAKLDRIEAEEGAEAKRLRYRE